MTGRSVSGEGEDVRADHAGEKNFFWSGKTDHFSLSPPLQVKGFSSPDVDLFSGRLDFGVGERPEPCFSAADGVFHWEDEALFAVGADWKEGREGEAGEDRLACRGTYSGFASLVEVKKR